MIPEIPSKANTNVVIFQFVWTERCLYSSVPNVWTGQWVAPLHLLNSFEIWYLGSWFSHWIAENLKDIELYWSSNFYIIPVDSLHDLNDIKL